jgi:hypothetical protein
MNYCRFVLSVAASSTFYGTGMARSQLWKEPYVLSEFDSRRLRVITRVEAGSLNYLAGAGVAGLCATGSGGLGSHHGK